LSLRALAAGVGAAPTERAHSLVIARTGAIWLVQRLAGT
jgi:hypothetical protein